MEPRLLFKRLSSNAFQPEKCSPCAAGFDLRSAYNVVVPARGNALVKTDLAIKIPDGCYGRIAPRSGLALKNNIDIGAGVIDRDYTGNVGIVLFNHKDEDFLVTKGDRVAQLICEKIEYPKLVEMDELPDTKRGSSGFGSTGINE